MDPGYQPEPWDGEHCADCGRGYGDVYLLDDDLWTEVTGHAGRHTGLKLCPSCLVRRALRAGSAS